MGTTGLLGIFAFRYGQNQSKPNFCKHDLEFEVSHLQYGFIQFLGSKPDKIQSDVVCEKPESPTNSSALKTREWINNHNFNDSIENDPFLTDAYDFNNDPNYKNNLDDCQFSRNSKTYTPLVSVNPNTITSREQSYDDRFEDCNSDNNVYDIHKDNKKKDIPADSCNCDSNNCSCSKVMDSFESKEKDVDTDVDFNINDCPSESSTSTEYVESIVYPIVDRITVANNSSEQPSTMSTAPTKQGRRITGKKPTRCKFCERDVQTKNFTRHLLRHHQLEKEVQTIIQMPKNSKERRQAFSLLRHDTNFELFIKGNIRPNRTKSSKENVEYYPCAYCKGLFFRNYLKRHAKLCVIQKNKGENNEHRINHSSQSQTMVACALDPTDVISKLDIKDKVFSLMKGDDIAFEAKKDLLIAHFGQSYFKKHRRERMAYACSNRMRELSRLLINYRTITNNPNVTFKDLFHPKHFDTVITTVRNIAGYDHVRKSFKAPSLAMHLGTSLKTVCDELIHLILKESPGYRCKSTEEAQKWIKEVKHFKELVSSRWNTELASIANKDMLEKRWNKPLLLPLASEVHQFRDGVLQIASECQQKLTNDDTNLNAYKLLVQCSLALLIVFNRRRIGDVQYLKIKNYKTDIRSDFKDFEHALTETEKILTKKYRRVINSGKGSRAVVILIPKVIQDFINLLLEHRPKYITDPSNEYVFAVPGSKIKWGKGDIAMRSLCEKLKIQNSKCITSNKLRKQIATIMQIMSLTPDETKQFANFMGHTEKTHNEFYELPVDLYQTAKVSKILLMMEKGSLPVEYKGKSLSEIDIDPNSAYAEEDNPGSYFMTNNYLIFVSITTPVNKISFGNDCKNKILGKFNESIELEEKNLDQAEVTISRQTITNERTTDQGIEQEAVEELEEMEKDEDVSRAEGIITNKKEHEKRRGWSKTDTNLVSKIFAKYIKNGTYPNTNDLKTFIQKTKMNKTVSVIKSKIQHLIKLKQKEH
ncbi:hypothetical protein FQR65_LT18464 [Abscondita terminalis]|nr:hypothetical protein FQR65_LT18464 [Abscondita terminalis]